MTTLTVQDLENAQLDTTTIGEVAMVGTSADTTTNRDGVVLDTLQGRLNKIGFEPPVAYGPGITFQDATDSAKTIDNGGNIYGCLASSRPFTTTGNFAADEANFFVVQRGSANNSEIWTYVIDGNSVALDASSGTDQADFTVNFTEAGFHEVEFESFIDKTGSAGNVFIEMSKASGQDITIYGSAKIQSGNFADAAIESATSYSGSLNTLSSGVVEATNQEDVIGSIKCIIDLPIASATVNFSIGLNLAAGSTGNCTGSSIKYRKVDGSQVNLV